MGPSSRPEGPHVPCRPVESCEEENCLSRLNLSLPRPTPQVWPWSCVFFVWKKAHGHFELCSGNQREAALLPPLIPGSRDPAGWHLSRGQAGALPLLQRKINSVSKPACLTTSRWRRDACARVGSVPGGQASFCTAVPAASRLGSLPRLSGSVLAQPKGPQRSPF